MKRVNLMPEECLRMQGRRRRRLVQLRITFGGLMGVMIWGGVMLVQLRTVDAEISALTRELMPLRQESKSLESLEREHVRLGEAVVAVERLRDPVPPAAILASLTQLFPNEAILTALSIEVSPSAEQDQLEAQAARRAPVRIKLEGDASTDVAIAELMGELAQSGLFHEVHLEKSREIHLGTQSHHRFRLSMEIQPPGSAALSQAR